MARILIIEDEYETRLALRTILESAGHQVTEATNGVEGAQLYTRENPDLVITDIMMPEQDGVETLLALRAENPAVRVIVVTGEEKEFLHIVEDFGAWATLTKPFDRTTLLNTVLQALA